MLTSQKTTDFSDAELAKKAAAGDAKAFCRIVERYQGPIYNLCYRYLGPSDAEDIAQETFVRAFIHKQSFDAERPLLPWLMTIGKRLCIDRLRKGAKEAVSSDGEIAMTDSQPSSEDVTSTKQQLAILADELNKLPEGQREVVALYHMDGLSYEEIAKVMNIPIGTVMTWLHRGRSKLKEILSSADEKNSAPRRC